MKNIYIYLLFYAIHFVGQYKLMKYGSSKNLKKLKQLPDLLLDNLPYYPSLVKYMDIILIAFFIPLTLSNNFINDSILFLKFFSIILVLRLITNFSTIIPPIKCRYNKSRANINKPINYLIGHNYDKIFSGHTSVILILIMIYSSRKIISKNKCFILFIFNIIYSFLILITRQHYTVDVILAYIITIPYFYLLKNYI